jgi:glycosyltransferase 2 family protein
MSTHWKNALSGAGAKIAPIIAILRKKPVAISISFVITVIALFFALKDVDLQKAFDAVLTMRVWPVLVAFVILAIGALVRSARWHLLMRRAGSTYAASLEAVLVSLFFNGVLPLRGGEAVRVLYFSRRTQAPVLATTTALVLERTLDLCALSIMAAIFVTEAIGNEFSGLPLPPWGMGAAAGSIICAMVGFGFWLRFRALRSEDKTLDQSFVARRFDEALRGLEALGSKTDIALIIALSVGMWMLTVLPFIFFFMAFGVSITYSAGVIILLGIAFAIALPSSPGFVGTYHVGFVAGAALAGISKDAAIPPAFVSHLITQVPFIIAGGIVLATGGRAALAKSKK